jgi:hypothetical protein
MAGEDFTAPDWQGDFTLSEDNAKALGKYDTVQAALDSTAEKETRLRTSVQVPSDTSSDEDRTKFNEKINTYRGVPVDAIGYEIEHPELPEGMEHQGELETQIHQVAKEHDVSNKALGALAKVFTAFQIGNHNALATEAQTTIKTLSDELRQAGKDPLTILGDGDKNLGTARRAAMELSKLLNLDYVDDHQQARSKLIDDMTIPGAKGCLGNKSSIIKVMQWIWENHFAEGHTPISGSPEKKGESVFDFTDMD